MITGSSSKKKIAGFLALSILLNSEVRADLRPAWMNSSNYSTQNETFLSDLKKDCAKESEINLLDQRKALGIRQSYEDISRDYELRGKYGISDMRSDYNYASQIRDFSRNVLNEVKAGNNRVVVDRLKDAEKRNPDMKYYSLPAVVAATLAQAAAGKPIMADLQVSSETKLHAESVVPEKRGSVNLSSPIVNTALHVQAGAPGIDPTVPLAVDLQDRQERYRVSVSRPIEVLTLTPGVEYGATSNTLSASLTKGLAPNLNCTVETFRPLDNQFAGVNYAQDRIRVGYEIHF